MTSFTYTPTDPLDAYKPTEVFGIRFPPGESVTIKQGDLKGALKVADVEAKLDGNPEFTKGSEDRQAVTDAKRRAKEAEAAEKLRAEADEATRAAAEAGPRF
jgi:hypothetical protein